MDLQMVDQLLEILEQEVKGYNEMLELSKNKRDVIIKGKADELQNIVEAEQSLVMQMGKLEAFREELTGKISRDIGLEPSELTISEMKKHFPEVYKEKATDYQEKLSATLKELKEINDLNSKLIKNSLEFVNFMINLYTSSSVGSNNYVNTGTIKETGNKSLFDVKL